MDRLWGWVDWCATTMLESPRTINRPTAIATAFKAVICIKRLTRDVAIAHESPRTGGDACDRCLRLDQDRGLTYRVGQYGVRPCDHGLFLRWP